MARFVDRLLGAARGKIDADDVLLARKHRLFRARGFAAAARHHPEGTGGRDGIHQTVAVHSDLTSLELIGIFGHAAANATRPISNCSFCRAKSAGSAKPPS